MDLEEFEDIGNGGNSGSGIKTKQLARAGMSKGGGPTQVVSRPKEGMERSTPRTYVELLKGGSMEQGKGKESDAHSDWYEENKLNT